MRTETPKRVADSRNAVKRDALSEEQGRGDAVLPVGQVSAPEVAAWSCRAMAERTGRFSDLCPLRSGREDCRFRA